MRGVECVRLVSVLVLLAGCSSRSESSSRAAPTASAVATAATGAALAVSAPVGAQGAPDRAVDLYGPEGVAGAKATRPRGDRAGEQALLRRAFPRFLASADQCPVDAGPAEKSFREGLFVPTIVTRLTGAFSAPGASEEVLGVSAGECGATHAENFGSRRLLVMRGGQLVASAASAGLPTAAVDIDGDGRSELLIESGGTGQGVTVVSLAVARVEGDRLVVLRDLGTVREDTCAAPSPDGDEVTRVRALSRGGAVEYEFTKEKRPCR